MSEYIRCLQWKLVLVGMGRVQAVEGGRGLAEGLPCGRLRQVDLFHNYLVLNKFSNQRFGSKIAEAGSSVKAVAEAVPFSFIKK